MRRGTLLAEGFEQQRQKNKGKVKARANLSPHETTHGEIEEKRRHCHVTDTINFWIISLSTRGYIFRMTQDAAKVEYTSQMPLCFRSRACDNIRDARALEGEVEQDVFYRR